MIQYIKNVGGEVVALLSVAEYAKKICKSQRAVVDKINAGRIPATKIGNRWYIDENEPYVDYRVSTGKYVDWRNKYRKGKENGQATKPD